jgi:hypothetical protein
LARDIADDVMELEIHLIQRLLHVVDVSCGHLHQALSMPEQRPDGAEFLFRAIRRPQ